jgi:predicted NUDIX family phosphoesterase
MQKQKEKNVFNKKTDEQILVVERKKLFQKKTIQGIEKIDFDFYQKLIRKHQEFIWRSKAETNANYKQIIPYIIFNYQNKYFIMQRKSNSSDTRLQSKYSFGIGGHIRKEDIEKKNLFDWARREFEEEVSYNGNFSITPIGILNDETNSVGQVHTGFVFLLIGDSDHISIRDEHKSGQLLTLEECKQYYNQMENWAKLVYKFILSQMSKN